MPIGRYDNAVTTYLDRNWLQWAEIAALLAGTIVLAPLALVGTAIRDGQLMGLGGLLGIAGLWFVTAPSARTARRGWKIRLTGTFLIIPGIIVASEFLRFEIRTGRDLSDALFALFICVLPMMIALHRLCVLWHPRWMLGTVNE